LKKQFQDQVHNFLSRWAQSAFSIVLLISVSLASCEEPELGLETQPGGDSANLLRELNLQIEATTEREDSVKTDELSLNLLGAYNDPVLGKIRSAIVMQLRPAVSNINLGTNPQADSIVLVVHYRSFYGDVSKVNGLQKFRAFRIREMIYRDSSYYSSDTLQRDLTPLGTSNYITPSLLDSVLVGGIKEAPHLRIKLDQALAAEFINNPSELVNADVFTAFFNGIYIDADTKLPNDEQGAILDFNLIGGARIDLFYQNDENDSLRTSFIVNESSARYTRFNHVYKPEVLSSLGSIESGKQNLYIHNMGGLRTKLRIPDLDLWKAGRNIIVHKAVMTFTVNTQTLGKYAPNPQLNIVLKDEDGNLILSPDLSVNSTSYSGGVYSNTTKDYTFNIARLVQAQLNDIITNENFYIQPSGTGISSFRTILNGTESLNGAVKFEVLYQILPN
jgi:hypothetical protein